MGGATRDGEYMTSSGASRSSSGSLQLRNGGPLCQPPVFLNRAATTRAALALLPKVPNESPGGCKFLPNWLVCELPSIEGLHGTGACSSLDDALDIRLDFLRDPSSSSALLYNAGPLDDVGVTSMAHGTHSKIS
mmetsp:Transcript_83147/g.193140  ORF Transcript_83147/g.193140 Transcript_83147/m.193140 type:complete len:134 (-) Transcript_83147:858-1259(-)